MPDIRVRDTEEWKTEAQFEAKRANDFRSYGMAVEITFYCTTRAQASAVEEYMHAHWPEVGYSVVSSENPHEIDNVSEPVF